MTGGALPMCDDDPRNRQSLNGAHDGIFLFRIEISGAFIEEEDGRVSVRCRKAHGRYWALPGSLWVCCAPSTVSSDANSKDDDWNCEL